MSILRSKREPEPTAVDPVIRSVAQAAYAKAYEDGYIDGLKEMILQLRGQSKVAPKGIYKGPLPDELDVWLRNVEEHLS